MERNFIPKQTPTPWSFSPLQSLYRDTNSFGNEQPMRCSIERISSSEDGGFKNLNTSLNSSLTPSLKSLHLDTVYSFKDKKLNRTGKLTLLARGFNNNH